ncbi:hypothetical protein SAY87_027365 [Trapa incisa]|uniref:AB hydrolase-1 domain-containing protein n=1 Tax=Trapa incisa TaxID=236973 RepID=A0AAN7JEU0_9MYRT|nr:hypothetical protein SAY87_027365 [Trapa incisa]
MATARRLRNGYSVQILRGLLSSSNPWLISGSRSLQTLAYEEVRASPSDKPFTSTAFVLHGLLGSGRNWRSFSRSLASTLSKSSPSSGTLSLHLHSYPSIAYEFDETIAYPAEWRMVLVDLRNHGKTAELEGFDPPHAMSSAAKDLANLVESRSWKWPDVVIGHSMGGKVALQFAESCARGDYGESAVTPKQLWVLDSVPGEVKHEDSEGEVEKVLKTLQSLPPSIPSRRWLVNHMLELGFSRSLSEWIGSNLKKSGEQETWAFNLDGAVQMFNSYRETSYWSLLEQPPKATEIAIVRAEKSDRWDPQTAQRLVSLAGRDGDESRGKFSLHLLPNAGHWVHVDNPKGLLEIVAPGILSF